MTRQLARIVRIDAITPIAKADAIVTAHIGGWSVVVNKNQFAPLDLAVYFELDSFLPTGTPEWQFLVDKVPTEYQGRLGHVLRSVTLRGQCSQGFLCPLSVLPADMEGKLYADRDVTAELGIVKFEKPIPAELEGKSRGEPPSLVRGTSQERVQNLADQLLPWQIGGQGTKEALSWEVTEKLEGSVCSFALLSDEFRVCSSNVDYYEEASNPFWIVARRLDIESKLRAYAKGRNLVLQGELVGPGIEGNHYQLTEYAFYLYRVYDASTGILFSPAERRQMAQELAIPHVPLVDADFRLNYETGMAELLALADGPSAIKPTTRREGQVYQCNTTRTSFKVVSNKYLLNAKL
jgi:RNA ligase (TIGR02306 family)